MALKIMASPVIAIIAVKIDISDSHPSGFTSNINKSPLKQEIAIPMFLKFWFFLFI